MWSRSALRNTIVVLLGLEAVLVAADLVTTYLVVIEFRGFRHLFDVTREGSLGNWFSSSQTLLAAIVLGLIAWRVQREGGSRWRMAGWALVALFFLYMAADDGAAIHERLGSYMEYLRQRAPDHHTLFGRLHDRQGSYAWQIVLGPLFGGMGLFMVVFFWRELRERTPRLLAMMGLGCFVMAVGLDHVEGTKEGYANVARFLSWSEPVVRHLGKVLEEFTEMFGTTMILAALLQRLLYGVRLELDAPAPAAAQGTTQGDARGHG
jgi:hypothetical protein